MSTSNNTIKQLSLLDPIEIPLTKNKVAIIDPIDADLCRYKWLYDGSYAGRRLGYKKGRIALHRIILERIVGRPLMHGEYCDHVNGDHLDNRRVNLRVVNPMQNSINRKQLENTVTGYKGVFKKNDRKNKPYGAHIRANGKRIFLGYFSRPDEAYHAYCEAAVKYHGKFARLK